jgi:hypothetical protein
VASAILAIKILADAAQAKQGLADADKATSKWSGGLSKAAAGATVALAAVTGVVVGGVKAAAEDAQQQAVLANALKKSAGATDKAVASTEDWISKTAMATGVADDQLRPALGTLVRATGDVAKAQEGMQLALDISAATGKDVTTVSAALAKGYAGQTTALGRLVPGMDAAVLKSGDMAKVSDELASKVGGSAAAAAGTAAGQFKIMQVGLGELQEGIGAALLPVITTLASKMAGLTNFVQDNQGAVNALVFGIGALAAIVITVNAVTKVWAVMQAVASAATTVWSIAQKVLNATLKDNPIGIVITVLALLVGGLILAYKNSETFRNIVDGAFRAVKAAAQFAWDWIKEHWPLLLAIVTGPIGLAVLAIAKHWDAITSGAQAVIGWFVRMGRATGIIAAPFTRGLSSGIIAKITAAVHTVSTLTKIPHPSVPDLNPGWQHGHRRRRGHRRHGHVSWCRTCARPPWWHVCGGKPNITINGVGPGSRGVPDTRHPVRSRCARR